MKNSPFIIFMAFLLIGGVKSLLAQKLSRTEKKIVEQVKSYEDESIAFLEKVVNINSGTMNLSGVREVGRVFQQAFNAIDFDTRWVEMPKDMNRAGHFFASIKGIKGKKLLLI